MLHLATDAISRLGAAGVKGARHVASASAVVAQRHSALQLRRAPARGARLLCSAGGVIGTTDVKGAYDLLQNGTPYLDVRTPEEYSGGHAPGAVNVPLMFAGAGGMSPNPAFLASAQAAMPDKGAQLLVGCKAGPRSGKACAALADAGYTAIMDVQGGWMAWEAAGLPVQK